MGSKWRRSKRDTTTKISGIHRSYTELEDEWDNEGETAANIHPIHTSLLRIYIYTYIKTKKMGVRDLFSLAEVLPAVVLIGGELSRLWLASAAAATSDPALNSRVPISRSYICRRTCATLFHSSIHTIYIPTHNQLKYFYSLIAAPSLSTSFPLLPRPIHHHHTLSPSAASPRSLPPHIKAQDDI